MNKGTKAGNNTFVLRTQHLNITECIKLRGKKRRAQPTEYSIIFHDKITQSLLVDFTKAQKHNLLQ
jgi:hypothetical protein